MAVKRSLASLYPLNSKLSPNLQLNHLLQKCSDCKAPRQGKQVQQQITVRGEDCNYFMVTKLVQMYADCDDFESAHILFDQLSHPNIFAWTAILSFYSRGSFFSQCLRTYMAMQSEGISPDNHVFPKVIRACTHLPSLNAGRHIHKDYILSGSVHNLTVCNSLINMYSKCGDIDNARRVFDRIPDRDVSSWNSMISGYAYNELYSLAIEVFHLMESEIMEPDSITWNTVLDAYCRMGLCDEAWEMLRNLEPNLISFTILVCGYSRMGKHKSSLFVFEQMIQKGVVFPDLDSLSSAIATCRHLNALSKGRAIHALGIKTHPGSEFYDSVGSALLPLYATCGRGGSAMRVFELMNKNDVVSWNAMIAGSINLNDDLQAVEYFRKMLKIRIQIDSVTISSVLPSCDLKTGREIHAHIIRSCRFDSVTTVWNAILSMYCKTGCLMEARSLFSTMPAKKDSITWNTMMGGFGIHGYGHAAISLLESMTQMGEISPDQVTFKTVLFACSHAGLVNEGLKVFRDMVKDYRSVPTLEHCACMVDLLCRAGRLEDARDFVERMGVEGSKDIWGVLLTASRECGNVGVAKLAAEKLFGLEPKHSGNYVALANVYALGGGWDDSVKVREMMDGRGCVKPTGLSRISGQ